MADVTIQLRTAPGETYQSVDLTNKCEITELAPADYDAVSETWEGAERRSKRAQRRRIRFPIIEPLTDTQVELLRLWKQNGTRICINPNWNNRTVFYARYARRNSRTGIIQSIIGPDPVFTRTISNSGASATRLRNDGRLSKIGVSVPRFETSRLTSPYYPATGIRPYGRHSNYLTRSHPENGTLIWSLTGGGASWTWNAELESVIADRTNGCGVFIGATGDYLSQSISSYGTNPHSIGLWIRGEGTFSLYVTSSGGTYETSYTALSPGVWTQLKLENMTLTGTVTIRLYSRATTSWCAVSDCFLTARPRLTGNLYNPTGAAVEVQEDDLYYDFQYPFFNGVAYTALEMPDKYATGEQSIFGLDQGSGDRLVFCYNGATDKFYFQRKFSATNIQWTPEKTAGNPTVVMISAGKDQYHAYENGNFKALASVNAAHFISRGLHVGWDGQTDTNGWNGLVYFLRIDDGPADLGEGAYVASLWGNTEQRIWTKLTEGRIFHIDSPEHALRAGYNRSRLDLIEIDSYPSATTEEA